MVQVEQMRTGCSAAVQVRIEDAELLKPWELKRREYKQRARLTGRRVRLPVSARGAPPWPIHAIFP